MLDVLRIYDWLICFSARNIIQAKKFNELLIETYREYVKETVLLENIFQVKKCGMKNPQIDKLRDLI